MPALEQSILDEMVSRLVAEFRPEQIILFGSHAWGEPSDDSDVDLYVIVPETDEKPIKRMQRAHHCLRGVGVSKDVLVQTRAEADRYRHVPASLEYRLFHEGRVLYG
jgi:uncharacterized protein